MKLKLILIILSLLVLVSCTGPFSNLKDNLFRGQTVSSAGEGIRMEVLNYPSELKQGQPFNIQILLTNYLLDPVEGRLCLFDSPGERGVIPGSGHCKEVSLQQAEKFENKLTPYLEKISFPLGQGTYAYTKVDEEFSLRTAFTAKFRYVADTKHGTDICIKNPSLPEDMLEVRCPDQESLTLQQPKTPIQITSVKKDVIPMGENQANLNIQLKIRKTQPGILFGESELQNSGFSGKETIRIKGISLGNTRFLCSPVKENNLIELRENERVINCYAPVNIESDRVEEIFVVHLSYGFEQKTNLPEIEVKHLGAQRAI